MKDLNNTIQHLFTFEEVISTTYSMAINANNITRIVDVFPNFIHLVTTSTAKSLVSLGWLEINDCKRMEEIVMNDTNEDVQGVITFNQLYSIKLTDMPSLKMFSSQSSTFKFPQLKEIEISGCPEMKMFCQGVLETPRLSKVKIEEHGMEWKDEEDLNKTMEGLSSAKVLVMTDDADI
ncbi:hypothetical protein K1719_041592 [Acacia pycnantha]|nr:hypothetical protein K1719_041592 [Acacia pycnantha]